MRIGAFRDQFIKTSLRADSDVWQITQDPEHVQQPEHHAYNYYGIQNRFDCSLHRNEAVHQPKQHTDNDQHNGNLNQWQLESMA